MAITPERWLRQTLTSAMEMRTEAVQDLVFNANPVTALLRSRGMFKPYYGPDIRVPLMIDKLQAQWFTGYDKLNNAPREILNSALFTPKNVAVGFSLTGTERLANEGRAQIIDLMDTYMQNAEDAMANEMETSIHGDGTGTGGRQMIGFGGAVPIIPNAGTYGGIDRSSVAMWRTSTFNVKTDFADLTGSATAGAWDSTTARPIIERIAAMRSKGRRYASLIIADIKAYQAISAACVSIQRIQDARTAVLGFDALQIQTPAGPVNVMCANGVGTVMPDNTIYGIDPDALRVYYHPSRNMIPLFDGDGAKPINQDAIAQYLVWNGEMVLENPRFTWRLITA
ncbi:phage major capsid protein [Asaia sp. HN010]|uniref:phage major capsid protein n=1 Tax=Asaia sp. HN010 TaxID=3081233 RepID=UPI00301AD774